MGFTWTLAITALSFAVVVLYFILRKSAGARTGFLWNCFPSLLEKVLRGKEVVIIREVHPGVKLVPAVRPGYRGFKGRIQILVDCDAPLDTFAE